MRLGSVICLFAFHRWVRRWNEQECEGEHVCLRCGKVLERPDGTYRVGEDPSKPGFF